MPHSWRHHCDNQSVRGIRLLLQRALGNAALRAMADGKRAISLDDADLSTDAASGCKRIGFF